MPTSGDLRSGDFFSDQHLPPHPDRVCQYDSLPLPPPPSSSNFAGKTWIYLSGTSSGWILIQSDSRLYRSNKEETLFYLFATNNLHHARKWSQKPLYKQKKQSKAKQSKAKQSKAKQSKAKQSKAKQSKSQMILEFWNIRSLNLIFFLWATDPNFLLYDGFWSPVRESGRSPLYPRDSRIIRWKRS